MVVSYTIDTLATDRGTLDLQSLRQLAYKLLGHWAGRVHDLAFIAATDRHTR